MCRMALNRRSASLRGGGWPRQGESDVQEQQRSGAGRPRQGRERCARRGSGARGMLRRGQAGRWAGRQAVLGLAVEPCRSRSAAATRVDIQAQPLPLFPLTVRGPSPGAPPPPFVAWPHLNLPSVTVRYAFFSCSSSMPRLYTCSPGRMAGRMGGGGGGVGTGTKGGGSTYAGQQGPNAGPRRAATSVVAVPGLRVCPRAA